MTVPSSVWFALIDARRDIPVWDRVFNQKDIIAYLCAEVGLRSMWHNDQ